MNLIKLIPYNLRERIRKIVFGKNHFHDLAAFAVEISCHVAFDVGAERGYESIVFAKAGMTVYAFEPDLRSFVDMCENIDSENVSGIAHAFPLFVGLDNGLGVTKTMSLARFIEINAVAPDLVKIDTDGDDIKVLNGYPFDKHRPMLLSVEYDATGAVDRKLLAEGYNLIYAIYKPQTRARRAIFSRYSLSPEFYGGEWGDVIAVLPQHYVALRDKLFGF